MNRRAVKSLLDCPQARYLGRSVMYSHWTVTMSCPLRLESLGLRGFPNAVEPHEGDDDRLARFLACRSSHLNSALFTRYMLAQDP